jgi:hypothetical protein
MSKTTHTPNERTVFGLADRLDDAYRTLEPRPLESATELKAYYKDEINRFRGDELTRRMELGLWRAWQTMPYKAFLMGHSGVGKSTELSRLLNLERVQSRFKAIRLSATAHLDPIGFKPFDVLLLMMHEVVRATAQPIKAGGTGQKPPDALLRKILDWFADETQTLEQSTLVAAQAEAGAGISEESLWAKAMGLFARIRGEMKYASTRKKEVVEYRLSQLSPLIEAANALMAECNHLLLQTQGCEWLFVIEDFDKMGVAPQATEDFFVTYANVIRDIQAHLVFTLPIALGYSRRSGQLPIPHDKLFCVLDTMVHHRDHTPHVEARAAIRTVLDARVSPDLFALGQLERLIVASGGNLRDLFAMTREACDTALMRGAERVEATDVDRSIRNLRTVYQGRLGDSPYDQALTPDSREVVTYEKKADLLVRIYNGEEEAKIRSAVLYSLLGARAVQEFNGERWFGVHPAVVDILGAQGRISPQSDHPNGKYPGGTI